MWICAATEILRCAQDVETSPAYERFLGKEMNMQKPNDSFDDPLASAFDVGGKQPPADDGLRRALLE